MEGAPPETVCAVPTVFPLLLLRRSTSITWWDSSHNIMLLFLILLVLTDFVVIKRRLKQFDFTNFDPRTCFFCEK